MPSGRPSGTLFSAQSLLWVSLPPSFALPGRVEAENCSLRGPKGVSGGPRKSPKIDSNSLTVPIGGLRRVRGLPPGCLRDTQSAYLCIFMHVFLRIRAYSCIFMHVYAGIYAYSCIFIHIYAYFMHVSCIFMHIYAYFMYIYVYDLSLIHI